MVPKAMWLLLILFCLVWVVARTNLGSIGRCIDRPILVLHKNIFDCSFE